MLKQGAKEKQRAPISYEAVLYHGDLYRLCPGAGSGALLRVYHPFTPQEYTAPPPRQLALRILALLAEGRRL